MSSATYANRTIVAEAMGKIHAPKPEKSAPVISENGGPYSPKLTLKDIISLYKTEKATAKVKKERLIRRFTDYLQKYKDDE